MNKKMNFAIIAMIFILPVCLFYLVESFKGTPSIAASVESPNKPKVLHFTQAMCSECKKLDIILKPVEKQYRTKISFIHIDVSDSDEKNDELISKYNVNVVPTMVFLNSNGAVKKVTEGSMTTKELKQYLDSIQK